MRKKLWGSSHCDKLGGREAARKSWEIMEVWDFGAEKVEDVINGSKGYGAIFQVYIRV